MTTLAEYLEAVAGDDVVAHLQRVKHLRDLEIGVREEGRLWELRAVSEEREQHYHVAREYFRRADELRAERMAILDRCGLR